MESSNPSSDPHPEAGLNDARISVETSSRISCVSPSMLTQ